MYEHFYSINTLFVMKQQESEMYENLLPGAEKYQRITEQLLDHLQSLKRQLDQARKNQLNTDFQPPQNESHELFPYQNKSIIVDENPTTNINQLQEKQPLEEGLFNEIKQQ